MKSKRCLLFCVYLAAAPMISLACTTLIITPGATECGAMFVVHSDDGHVVDARLMYVPPADHPPGSMRPVHYDAVSLGELPQYAAFSYRRYTGDARGPDYAMPGKPQTEAIGYIPQVARTYGYFDGNYGIMNEHQLMFGECTNGSKTDGALPGPDRLFYSAELARVALERCTTAREAVLLIGELIDTYGLYGTGETLPVADPNEGWVIEMIPGPDAMPSLWVAQRVPDGEVFMAANSFRIRDIDPDNPDQIFSTNLHTVAEAQGWWKPEDGLLDWLSTVSLGEYNHPYYSLRRVWRLLDKLAPSRQFSPWVEDGFTRAYPFSIAPEQKLSRKDVRHLLRDHYEGTEFDMTQGVAAGPFGCPYRYLGSYEASGDVSDPTRTHEGAWERPLSVYYCTYVFVGEARSWLPDPIGGILWFGNGRPAQTVFAPFYAGIHEVAAPYTISDARIYSRDSAFWVFKMVENWAALNYRAIQADIEAKQQTLEREADAGIALVDQQALALHQQSPEAARAFLTEFSKNTAHHIVSSWLEFSDRLIARYADGGINYPGKLNIKSGYPRDWLETTDWPHGPIQYEPSVATE